ncbi:hypothetical protein J3R74_000655 [Puniceicoccus vermicola]
MIDGRLEKGEWDDASAVTGVISQLDGYAHPRQAVFFLSYDDRYFYIAQRSTVFPEELVQKGPKTWAPKWDPDASDSNFFVGLAPGRKGSGDSLGIYTFRPLVEKVKDRKTGDPEWYLSERELVREYKTVKLPHLLIPWESGAEMEANVSDDEIWIAEMRIPLASMNVEAVLDGEDWGIFLARDYSQADQNALGVSTDWRFGGGWRHYGRAFFDQYLKEEEYLRATLASGVVAVQALELWSQEAGIPTGETRSRIQLKNTGSLTKTVQVVLKSTETDTVTKTLSPGARESIELFQKAPTSGQEIAARVTVTEVGGATLLEQSLPLKGDFYRDRREPLPSLSLYPSHMGGIKKNQVLFASGYDPISNRFYGRIDLSNFESINEVEEIELTIRKGGSEEPLLSLAPTNTSLPEAVVNFHSLSQNGVVLEWLAPDDGLVNVDMEAAHWNKSIPPVTDGEAMQVLQVRDGQVKVIIQRDQYVEPWKWKPLVKHGIDVKKGDRIQFYYDSWKSPAVDRFIMRGNLTQDVYGVTKTYTPGGDFSSTEQGGINGAWFYKFDTDKTTNPDGVYEELPLSSWEVYQSEGTGWGRGKDPGNNQGFISQVIFSPQGELTFDEEIPVLEPGIYQATATARGAQGEVLGESRYNFIRFDHQKDLPWLGNQLGVSSDVQPPWTPIQYRRIGEGIEKFSVWGRDYEIEGSGLIRNLEVATESGLDREKRNILAGPIHFEMIQNGEAFVLKPEERVSQVKYAENEASWEGAVSENGWRIETDVYLEYDGYAAHIVRIIPPESQGSSSAEATVEKLRLVIPLKEKYAFNLHAIGAGEGHWFRAAVNSIPLDTSRIGQLWHSGQMSGSSTTPRSENYGKPLEAGNFRPYVWLGGANRGIAFMADSDEGWVPGDKDRDASYNKVDHPSMEVIRQEDGSVALVLNLVARPFAFDHERTVRFSLQATPIKPVPEDWRDIRIDLNTAFPGFLREDNYTREFGGDRFPGWGWMGNRINVDGQKWVDGHGSTPYPLNWDQAASYREYAEENRDVEVTPYQGLHSILSFAEVDDPRMPAGKQASDIYGYIYPHMSHNHLDGGNGSGSQADLEYRLWNYNARIQKTGIKGMYFDLTEPVLTANPYSGFGYFIDLHDRPEINGKVQGGFGLTRIREFFKRLRQLFLEGPAGENDRTYIWLHTTDGNTVSAYAFTDIFLEGENGPSLSSKQPYISVKIPAGRMQVMNNGAGKWGFQMTQLTMQDHSVDHEMNQLILNNIRGWYQLHDVALATFTEHQGIDLDRKAIFLPYWDPDVAEVLSPRIEDAYASAYLQDNALALVVVNNSDQARTVPVLVDPAGLGMMVGDDPHYSVEYVVLPQKKERERRIIEREKGGESEAILREFEERWSQIPMKPEIRNVQTDKLGLMVWIEPRGYRIIRLEAKSNNLQQDNDE